MKLLNENKEEIDSLDLGIVEAGKSKEYSYYLLNNSSAELNDIKIKIMNDELELLDYPKILKPESSGILKIKWSPSVSVKKGLKASIEIKGIELYS